MAAVYPDARNPFAHPELLAEGFEPWSVPEIYLMTFGTPDVYVDITDTVERKLHAEGRHPGTLNPQQRRPAIGGGHRIVLVAPAGDQALALEPGQSERASEDRPTRACVRACTSSLLPRRPGGRSRMICPSTRDGFPSTPPRTAPTEKEKAVILR